jgi:hypothetical protein
MREPKYRLLEAGEIIKEGDEVDASRDPMRDEPLWRKTNCVGDHAPDPRYISHRHYRRIVEGGAE